MPELVFKAFLSCSFADEDREVVEYFKRLISAFNIEPVVYDYQDTGKLTERIKENIVNADCLIAIATRRTKVEGSDSWVCADWIQHEVALANGYRKPIAIFYEDGVRIDGLIAMEERRERFSREQLARNVDKVVRFLYNLRKKLETSNQLENSQGPLFIRHYVHIKEEILSKAVRVTRCEILMECLADQLSATHHWNEVEEKTSGLLARPHKFDFICKEHPDGVKVETRVIQDTDLKYMWQVVFSPPLKRGQRVRYAYKLTGPNNVPFTYEEMTDRISKGTYEYDVPVCEACEWVINSPTSELQYEIDFPEDYEVADYRCDVEMTGARLKDDAERRRLVDGNMFLAEKVIDKWTMRLKVPKPQLDHVYFIFYVPPKARGA